MTFFWYCSKIEELLTETHFIAKSELVRSTLYEPRSLVMGMAQTHYLGFYLDNKRLYCNQCWPMDCNCRLRESSCRVLPPAKQATTLGVIPV